MAERIVLVRHGHVAGIEPPRFRGRTEIPLSELGLRQAASTAHYLANFSDVKAIYCSPLGRCVSTAEIIGEAFGLSPSANPELHDIDYGAWQGQSHDEVRAGDPAGFALWSTRPDCARIPGGESLSAVAARATHVLWSVLSLHPGSTTILVSHDSVNRLLLLHVLRLPLARYWHIKQHPCAISILERAADDWTVHSINETAHLDSRLVRP